MSIKRTVTGKWVYGRNTIECTLPLIIFKEDDNIITFCPALDLSGYGFTEEEANHAFEETLSEYFRYTVNKKTLAEDLEKMGWKIRKNLRKPAIPPTMDDLLKNNEDFKRIFNTYDFHKRNTTINIPEFA